MKLIQRIPCSMLQYVIRDVLPRDEWNYQVSIIVQADEEKFLKRRLEPVTFETKGELVMFLQKNNYDVIVRDNILFVSVNRPSDDCHTYT